MTRTSLLGLDATRLQTALPPARLAHWNMEMLKQAAKPDELRRNLAAFEAILNFKDSDMESLQELAREIQANCDHIVVLGSRGAYVAAQTLIGYRRIRQPIHFDGYHFNPHWTEQLIQTFEESGQRIGVVAVAQGPIHSELAWSFERYQQRVVARHGEAEAKRRIVIVGDGALGGYRRVALPERVSSQFWLFTAANFLPLLLVGLDAQQFLEGARSLVRSLEKAFTLDQPSLQYAMYRQILLGEQKLHEVFVQSDPALEGVARWWRYLMEESHLGLGAYPHPLLSTLWEDRPLQGQHFEIAVEVDPQPEDDFQPILEQAWARRPAPRMVIRIPRADMFSLGALCGFFAVSSSLNHRMGQIPLRSDSL